MKRGVVWVVLLALNLGLQAQTSKWSQSYAEMSDKAKTEGKYLLMNFAGTKWCGWCIRLDEEVFSQKEFKLYAKDNLALLLLDYPRREKLPEDLQKQNMSLAQKYELKGFPTIILLSPTGEFVAKTGYQAGGPKAYIPHLKQLFATYEAKQKVKEKGKQKEKQKS